MKLKLWPFKPFIRCLVPHGEGTQKPASTVHDRGISFSSGKQIIQRTRWHLRTRAHVGVSLIRKCFPENTLSVPFYKCPEKICFKAFFIEKKLFYCLLSAKTFKPWIFCRSKALVSVSYKSVKLVDEETEATRKKR